MDLAATIAGLAAERDRLRAEADRLDAAITALRALEESPAVVAPRPAVPRPAMSPVRPAGCQYAPCGKPLTPRSTPGRPKRFCDRTCAKRASKSAPREEASPAAPDTIPESGGGMKARIAQMLKSDAVPKSHFLERAEARNKEAARRSAASAGR